MRSIIFISITAVLSLLVSYFFIKNNILHNAKKAALETFQNKKLVAEVLSHKADSTFPLVSVAKPSFKAKSKCSFGVEGNPTHSSVVFSEIAWMGSTEDSGEEWIELVNTQKTPLSLEGFEVIDKDDQIHVVLPNIEILPDSYYVLGRNAGFDFVYEGNLKNSEEALRLFDSSCNLVDEVSAFPKWGAGDLITKMTAERNVSDLSWHTSGVVGGTPKRTNSMPVVLGVSMSSSSIPVSSDSIVSSTANIQLSISNIFITEVMAGKSEDSNYEFVELFNANDFPVDLTGWSLKKKSSSQSESPLLSAASFKGKTIPQKSYFLLGRTGGYSASPPADVFWPSSYALAYSKNSVVLFNPDHIIVDSVTWDEIPKDQSYSRTSVPDKVFQIAFPTPKQ